ncbi:MAG: hypothetical protein KF901_15015 [Myxococcales bacterium]|nr:hypothetical protein [Myxococcales bacterium]
MHRELDANVRFGWDVGSLDDELHVHQPNLHCGDRAVRRGLRGGGHEMQRQQRHDASDLLDDGGMGHYSILC